MHVHAPGDITTDLLEATLKESQQLQ